MRIKVDAPSGPMTVKLKQIPEQTRRAMSDAMNTSVQQAEVDVASEMRRVFDRPTPWALGGVTHDKATPNNLSAVVRIRGKAGAAIPAESFLAAQIDGGQRRFKRFEVALYKAGVLPAGYYAVPAADQRTDAFGNMPGGRIRRLLSDLTSGLFVDQARRARGTRRTRGSQLIVIRVGSGKHPGVYERADFGALGQGLRPVLLFIRSATYRKRLSFYEVTEKTVDRMLPMRYAAEMQQHVGQGGAVR